MIRRQDGESIAVTKHTHTRQYYLSDIPLSEALQKFHDALAEAGALTLAEAETLALDQAHGRVTASPVWAARSSPHYDAAAMDGVAVRARETIGATETSPLRLTVGEQAVWVDTGDPMPPGFDAVIMIEVIHEVDASTIEIQAPVAPYQHVRPLGEDIVATELVLPGSHLPQATGSRRLCGGWTHRSGGAQATARCRHPNWDRTRPHRHRAQTGRHRRVQLPHAWRHDGGMGRQSDTLARHS